MFSLGSVTLKNLIEMEDNNDYTPERLEMFTYRYLQQIAKNMGLPSNVKKVQLIALIHAKKSHTPEEVENIIQRVKQDRLRLSQAKKNRKNRKRIQLQVTEVSSTRTILSPPITVTPTRHISVRHYSPKRQIIQYKPKRTVLNLNKTLIRKYYLSPKTIQSDRVLRSFNAKSNYGMMNSVIGVIKAPNSMANREARINIFGQDGGQRYNVTPGQVSSNMPTVNPLKRQRAISGIYPLHDIPNTVQYMKNQDKLSQTKTYLQPNCQRNEEQNTDITVHDIIDSNVSQSLLSDEYNDNHDIDNHDNDNQDIDDHANDNHVNNHDNIKDYECSSVYIRPQQVKSSQKDWPLPKINDAFSQFSFVHRRDLCKPIYVQVSKESERIHNYPLFMGKPNVNNTTMMESLYNFKNQFILNRPLVQVATTSNTRCVFSTPTVATPNLGSVYNVRDGTSPYRIPQPNNLMLCCAMVQPTHTIVSNEYYTSCERDSRRQDSVDTETLPRTYHYFPSFEQEMAPQRDLNCNEVMNTPSSSSETGLDSSQELGANVTISDMVEDALEVISQDGDYMERIGMDVRMQCVLCSWAGPGIILENHLRKNHSNDIQSLDTNECIITYNVGRLVQEHLWLSQVIEYDSVLYVLSAKYEDPDDLMVNIGMIFQDTITPQYAKITLYNKVTGEPYSWQGEIHQISPSMLDENQINCLKVELSNLNLLPNSANLKLLNRQLVMKSPVNVIVGQPELDNIHIVVFVRFLDYL